MLFAWTFSVHFYIIHVDTNLAAANVIKPNWNYTINDEIEQEDNRED